MKKASAAWNRGNVSDDVILKDLVELSGGKVTIPQNIKLMEVKDLIGPKKKKPVQRSFKSKKKYQSRH
jgi:hypothetical protein